MPRIHLLELLVQVRGREGQILVISMKNLFTEDTNLYYVHSNHSESIVNAYSDASCARPGWEQGSYDLDEFTSDRDGDSMGYFESQRPLQSEAIEYYIKALKSNMTVEAFKPFRIHILLQNEVCNMGRVTTSRPTVIVVGKVGAQEWPVPHSRELMDAMWGLQVSIRSPPAAVIVRIRPELTRGVDGIRRVLRQANGVITDNAKNYRDVFEPGRIRQIRSQMTPVQLRTRKATGDM
jgi:hypothetical protein